MSGGSFGYLFRCSPQELLSEERRDDLKEMAVELRLRVGADHPATFQTLGMLTLIQSTLEVLNVCLTDELRDCWRAVEWERSGDGHENQIEEACAAYHELKQEEK